DPFFPGSSPITIELRYHTKTGRVLGADLAGRFGVDKRVDVIATAIQGGLSVDDLAWLDLAYAPPYSAARDPVNVAATVAANSRRAAIRALSASELVSDRDRWVVVDVRSNGAAFDQAIVIPLATLKTRLAELPKGRIVFVDEG